MSQHEKIQSHQAGIQRLESQLSAALTDQAKFNTRRAELRNWLAGHDFSAQELEARGVTAKHAAYRQELAELDERIREAKSTVKSLEETRNYLKGIQFQAAEVLGARKAAYATILGEWTNLLESDAALIAQREQASEEGRGIKRVLRESERLKAMALSVAEVATADKTVAEASQRQAHVDDLIRNIDTRLAKNGTAKDAVRARLREAERELWRAQSAALLEDMRSQSWYAECETALLGAFGASLKSGDAFDLGRFLAVVFSGRQDDARIDPAVITGIQGELAGNLGIDEGVAR